MRGAALGRSIEARSERGAGDAFVIEIASR